ncbi:MAG: L-threonylcarbamoyladenylate synthase [Bryobacteraceae bacterium]
MIDHEQLRRAAAILRAGGLVALPTETVYGLGANALDPAAVERIFAAKGRPKQSPIIVHVVSIEMARGLAKEWPDVAQKLAEAFWPGPLTLVVAKNPIVPDIVTAGLPTVGLRWPAHPVAQALIAEAGIPIAAPSANRFTELSPTSAGHVRTSLGSSVELILDGGPCEVGLESTVVSVAGAPLLLRPGMISRRDLERVAGVSFSSAESPVEGAPHRSPGLHLRHYSPRTRVVIAGNTLPDGRGAYLWTRRELPGARSVRMPADPSEFARILYETFHDLDVLGLDWIAVEPLPESSEWEAIRDRIARASH